MYDENKAVVTHDEHAVLPTTQKDLFLKELKGLNSEGQTQFFAMLDSYISVPSELIDEYLNQTIKVLGCLIEEIPESVDEETGNVLKGYRQVLLKLEEKDKKGHYVVIRIGTRKMIQKAEMWAELWGMGDWKRPQYMKVFLDRKQKLLQIVSGPSEK